MNIFVLHLRPDWCAQYHCDTHVVKMILETAQLLYSALWVVAPAQIPEGAYRQTHVTHPCAIWARASLGNYRWLSQLGLALCAEYTFRYQKIHTTQRHLEWLATHPPPLPACGRTPFPQAMPEQYRGAHAVQAYRTFYRESKHLARGIVRYTKRPWPKFLVSQ